jgi:hypothetical protein
VANGDDEIATWSAVGETLQERLQVSDSLRYAEVGIGRSEEIDLHLGERSGRNAQ